MYTIVQTLFVIAGILMVILILLRKSDVAGLSSAFGGLGGDTAFGVKTQKQLDKIITYVAIFFMVAGLLLNTPKMKAKPTPPVTPTTTQETPTTPTTPTTPSTPNK
jgi:protein translocase SecG subunit